MFGQNVFGATPFGANGAGELPPIVATASIALDMPRITTAFAGHDASGEQAAEITLPAMTATARAGSGVYALLPAMTAKGAATTVITAVTTGVLPTPSVSTQGRVAAQGTGAIALPVLEATGASGAIISIEIAGRISLASSGKTGAVGRATFTLPLLEATAAATLNSHAGAALTLPSLQTGATSSLALSLPGLSLTAIGTADVTATYEAYAVNLKHAPRPGTEPIDEMTRYTDFPFTHVVRYKNSYYGANSTGLYLLEGTTDSNASIPWAVKTAMTDCKSPTKKTLASTYLSGRLGNTASLVLDAGEGTETASYAYSTPRSSTPKAYRQKFGKGLRARYYSLAMSGSEECELDSIELDVHNMTRRI